MHKVEVFGYGSDLINASACDCEHCGTEPCKKEKMLDVYKKFSELLGASALGKTVTSEFIEISDESLMRNDSVRELLSVAHLEPAICLDGKVMYLGGFSPEGLLEQLEKLIGEKNK